MQRAMHIAAAEMKTEPNRYLLIETSGGLNQQRTGVYIFSSSSLFIFYLIMAPICIRI